MYRHTIFPGMSREDVKREVRQALEWRRGNVTLAADTLDCSTATIYRMVRKYRIPLKKYRRQTNER